MHAHEKPGPVRVHVVTVSTSRDASTDRSGPVIRELLGASGHACVGSTIVPDDPAQIGGAIDALLPLSDVEAIVLTGGTGISARDCTPAVVRARLDREIPGFGELFRMLSYREVGTRAMLSSALAGVARGKLVFALPGSPNACRLALEKLILPELRHLTGELAKEAPLPAPTAAKAPSKPTPAPAPVAEAPPEMLTQLPSPERPPEEDIGSGWRAGLRALGGEVVRGSLGEIPEDLERLAPAMDVLNAAGDRAVVRLANGREYTAFGYPDLVRNVSKVLLVREGEPFAEVVALHRWPKRVGICVEGDEGIVPSAELDPGPIAEERTGAPYRGAGQLFAVEGGSIYVLQGRKVAQFDGRNTTDGWPLSSAVGTLLLHWSQR